MLDKMNRAILNQLKKNSRKSWQQIGKEVHLTGQAVAARVLQMEEQGVITGYTIRVGKLGRHFITVFMDTNDFTGFERFLQQATGVEAAYKVSGDGCYQIHFVAQTEDDLEPFLNALLRFGRYKLASAIRSVV